MIKTKLYLNSNGTKVNVTDNSLPTLTGLLPSIEDIKGHLKAQLGEKQFRPIIIEVTKEKLEAINIDIRKRSCSVKGYAKIAIYLESYSSRKVLPIIQILEKQ